MSEPIKVGDLVYVAYPSLCCGNSDAVGRHFTVGKITHQSGFCIFCNAPIDGAQAKLPNDSWIRCVRLKRIPPLSELESKEIKEEIPA